MVPDIHPDEFNRAVLVFQVDLGQGGCLVPAGAAPGCPEVHHHDLSRVVGQPPVPAVDLLDVEAVGDADVGLNLAEIDVDAQASGAFEGQRSPEQQGQESCQGNAEGQHYPGALTQRAPGGFSFYFAHRT